jgi:hypothetical protein
LTIGDACREIKKVLLKHIFTKIPCAFFERRL